ncbi:SGNH/GDSL hydrolase family protein [Fibrisoma montanum]|uniref:SGNH/GDSL hydrolase family protein n=1 Tax=Fibrisoma montanum TaxID=2305895 RepID=A0A418MB52_9BACT|nr:SGNH/GDSL hydrolase family protein [Fibrisoma montanum]RIV23605.1 SGNH/GDSL hydrolase family protein [Fibrisoma montanum]
MKYAFTILLGLASLISHAQQIPAFPVKVTSPVGVTGTVQTEVTKPIAITGTVPVSGTVTASVPGTVTVGGSVSATITNRVSAVLNNVSYMSRVLQSFENRLEVEGMPIFQAFNNTNISGSVSNNQTYFSFTPQVGTKVWIEELQITVPEALTMAVQWQNSGIAVAGFGGNYMARRMLPGVENRIPIRRFVPNNVTIAVTQVGNYTLTSPIGVTGTVQAGFSSGLRTSMDFQRNAERVILKLHDSIWDGSGPASWDDYSDVKLRNRLVTQTGQTWEILSKGKGGFTSSNIEVLRTQGQLNVLQADIILYEPMMNDASAATYDANLANIIAWKQTYFPRSLLFVIGIYPRSDAQETILAAARTAAQTRIAALNDPRIIYVPMGDLWNPSTQQGTYTIDNIHANAAGHALMDSRMWSYVQPTLSLLP